MLEQKFKAAPPKSSGQSKMFAYLKRKTLINSQTSKKKY